MYSHPLPHLRLNDRLKELPFYVYQDLRLYLKDLPVSRATVYKVLTDQSTNLTVLRGLAAFLHCDLNLILDPLQPLPNPNHNPKVKAALAQQLGLRKIG